MSGRGGEETTFTSHVCIEVGVKSWFFKRKLQYWKGVGGVERSISFSFFFLLSVRILAGMMG